MPLNLIPSWLGSSLGSKSTNALVVGGGGRGGGGAGGEEGFYCHPDERSRALGSSWISRLHLQHLSLPPTPRLTPATRDRRKFPPDTGAEPAAEAGDGAGVASQNNKRTISTDELCTPTSISNFNSSFVVRRYDDLLGRRTAGFLRRKSLPPRIVYSEGGVGSVRGFGPFQVRSRNPGLYRGAEGSFRRDLDRGTRVLGEGDYGSSFPLVRRMAHLGEALNRERGMLGFHVGRARESVHEEEGELNQGNACSPSRRSPYVRNQVKLSPFFQCRPSFDSDYSIDRSKGIVSLSIDEGSAAILQHRDPMRPIGHEHRRMPMAVSCFQSQDLIDDSPSRRAYEESFSNNAYHSGGPPVQHVTRSRGVVYPDGVDAAASVRRYGNMLVKSLGKIPACAEEPEEKPFSFWDMGRSNRRNTISSASPTELRSNLGLKRGANFETSFPQKFTRLSDED